jgi:hypothetical protein
MGPFSGRPLVLLQRIARIERNEIRDVSVWDRANRTRGTTYLHLNLARRQSIVDPTGVSPRVAMLERADPDIAIARRRRA